MEEKILEILKKVSPAVMEYDGDDLLEDEVLESMEIMDIVVALEENLGIEIAPELIAPEYFLTKDTIVKMALDACAK